MAWIILIRFESTNTHTYYLFNQVNFLLAPSCPGFFLSLTLMFCVNRPAIVISSAVSPSTRDLCKK